MLCHLRCTVLSFWRSESCPHLSCLEKMSAACQTSFVTPPPSSICRLTMQPHPGIQNVSSRYPLTTILCSAPEGLRTLPLRADGRPATMNTEREPPWAFSLHIAVALYVVALHVYGRSAASGLPCAGAAPPQRPPPKPSLTNLCAFFAASRLASRTVAVKQWPPKRPNGSRDDWLVNYCRPVVTSPKVSTDGVSVATSGRRCSRDMGTGLPGPILTPGGQPCESKDSAFSHSAGVLTLVKVRSSGSKERSALAAIQRTRT